jgi:murein endopeptidase
MPMPDRVLSKEERENILASNLVAADGKHVDDKTWSPADVVFIRTAAGTAFGKYRSVPNIFLHV